MTQRSSEQSAAGTVIGLDATMAQGWRRAGAGLAQGQLGDRSYHEEGDHCLEVRKQAVDVAHTQRREGKLWERGKQRRGDGVDDSEEHRGRQGRWVELEGICSVNAPSELADDAARRGALVKLPRTLKARARQIVHAAEPTAAGGNDCACLISTNPGQMATKYSESAIYSNTDSIGWSMVLLRSNVTTVGGPFTTDAQIMLR